MSELTQDELELLNHLEGATTVNIADLEKKVVDGDVTRLHSTIASLAGKGLVNSGEGLIWAIEKAPAIQKSLLTPEQKKEIANKAMEGVVANLASTVNNNHFKELIKINAQTYKIRYDAYKEMGFSDEQAFELLKLTLSTSTNMLGAK